MNQEHETPTPAIFEDLKKAAVKVWETYDDTYGYATEKIQRIQEITNYKDNIMQAFRMFDGDNQLKMLFNLKQEESAEYITNNL